MQSQRTLEEQQAARRARERTPDEHRETEQLRVEAEARLLTLEALVRDHRASKVPSQWTKTEKAMFAKLPESVPHREA